MMQKAVGGTVAGTGAKMLYDSAKKKDDKD